MKNSVLFSSMVMAVLYAGCQSVEDKAPLQAKTPDSIKAIEMPGHENGYRMEHKAGAYSFFIESDNREISNIHVYTKGLEHEYDDTVKLEGQVLESFMLDLNKDGFKEFYLAITPTDDSGNINIAAFASNKDKSISAISIVDSKLKRAVGTDTVFVDDGRLKRSFTHNGQSMDFSFKLTKGEAAYILSAQQN